MTAGAGELLMGTGFVFGVAVVWGKCSPKAHVPEVPSLGWSHWEAGVAGGSEVTGRVSLRGGWGPDPIHARSASWPP
jgi:hypothetical protein